jgi:hypothetical protein
MFEAREDARRNAKRLESNEASEFSYGKGLVPPQVADFERRTVPRRYATPAEGGRYHGKTPPLRHPIIGSGRHRPHH